jgi:hypothetical protein
VRIVIEDGDELTIETRRAGALAQAAVEAIDGGGAPSALIRQFAEGAERGALEAEGPEGERRAEPPAGKPALNPLRAGAAAARAEGVEREGGGGEAREGGAAPTSPAEEQA